MSGTEEFEDVRSFLLAVAYRITGDADAAREAVEETRRRYHSAPVLPAAARAFLAAEVTRISWRLLRSPRARRHQHAAGPRPAGPAARHQKNAGRPTEPSPAAAVLLLERLSPPQRAVYVLREVFGCEAARAASVMGCSEAVCHRLTASVAALAGPGGRAVAWPRRITGAHQVARALAAIFPALQSVGVTARPHDDVRGDPGMTFHDRHGTLLAALSLSLLDGRVQTLHWVTGPEDLDGIRQAG